MQGAGKPAVASEVLLPEERLRRGADYLRCYRLGRRRGGPFFVLHWIANDLTHPRFGITASRKVGKAVVRNRIRRRLRESYRRFEERREMPALDLVVHVKPPAAAATFDELQSELYRLLRDARRGRSSRRRRRS